MLLPSSVTVSLLGVCREGGPWFSPSSPLGCPACFLKAPPPRALSGRPPPVPGLCVQLLGGSQRLPRPWIFKWT